MQDCIHVHPVLYCGRHARLDFEHAVWSNRELWLVARLNTHLARRNGANAPLSFIGLQLQRGTRLDCIDTKANVIHNRHHMVGGEIGFGEGDVCPK